jgi:hypothetical protein
MKPIILTAFINLISVLVPQSHSQAIPTQKFSPDPIVPSEAPAESPLTVTVNDAEAPKPGLATEPTTIEPAAMTYGRSETIAVDNSSPEQSLPELTAPTVVQDPRHEIKDPCIACGMG